MSECVSQRSVTGTKDDGERMNAGRQVNQREGVVGKRKTSSYGEEGGKDFCMAGRGVTAAVDGLGCVC